MEVGRPLPSRPPNLYSSIHHTGDVEKATRLYFAPHQIGAGKSRAPKWWLPRGLYQAQSTPAGPVASYQEGFSSAAHSERCSQLGNVVDVLTKRSACQLGYARISIRKTPRTQVNSEVATSPTLLSNVEGLQNQTASCSRKRGLHSDIPGHSCAERPEITAGVTAHCTALNAAYRCLPSGSSFQRNPNVSIPSLSSNGAGTTVSLGKTPLTPRAHHETFYGQCRLYTQKDGRGVTASAGERSTAELRRTSRPRGNKRLNLFLRQLRLQPSPEDGLNDEAGSPSRHCPSQPCWNQNLHSFQGALFEHAASVVAPALKDEVVAASAQECFSWDQRVEGQTCPFVARGEPGKTSKSISHRHLRRRGGVEGATQGTADAAASDFAPRAPRGASAGRILTDGILQRSPAGRPAGREASDRLPWNESFVQCSTKVHGTPTGGNPAAPVPGSLVRSLTLLNIDERFRNNAAAYTPSVLTGLSKESEPNMHVHEDIAELNSDLDVELCRSRRMLLPVQTTHLHMFFLAWKRLATERSLLRDLHIAARRQIEGRLLRRCLHGFRQHKERRAQLYVKSDICALHTLKQSASRHFSAWIRIFYAASARNAFLKSFALRGFQHVTYYRQQQSISAVAARESRLKLQAVKSIQDYVNIRRRERAAFRQATVHHKHAMLKKGLYSWSRWHAYINACIKLLSVASQLEAQRNHTILPVFFNVWKAETKRSTAETNRALKQAELKRMGLAFGVWRRRSGAAKLLRVRRNEYLLQVQKNVLHHWKVACCARWKHQEALQRKVCQITKRRGLTFLRTAFAAWQRYTRRRTELSRAYRLTEERRKRKALQDFQLAAFLLSVSRCVSENAAARLASKALSTWRARSRQHKRERFISFFFLKQREKYVTVTTWAAWRHVHACVHASKMHFKARVLRKAYAAWNSLQKKQSCLREALHSWKCRTTRGHQARCFHLWRSRACSLRNTKAQVFSAWRCAVESYKHAGMALEKVVHSSLRRVLSENWFTWKTVVHKERQVQKAVQNNLARRVLRAMMSHVKSCTREQIKTARIKSKSKQMTYSRAFSTWLRKVQVRRRARSAYETVNYLRKGYLLSSIFYEWIRAAGLHSPTSSTLKSLSTVSDSAPHVEICSFAAENSRRNLRAAGRTDGGRHLHRECSDLQRSCFLKYGESTSNAAYRRLVKATKAAGGRAKRLKHKGGLVCGGHAIREASVEADPTDDAVEFSQGKSIRIRRSFEGSASQSDEGSTNISYISSEATTASEYSHHARLSRVGIGMSRGRQQVYMDFFWDAKMLKILTAWRSLAQRRLRCCNSQKTSNNYGRRYAVVPTGALSKVCRSAAKSAQEAQEGSESGVPASPPTPRYAYQFVDDVSYSCVSLSKQDCQAQHVRRPKLRQVLLFRRMRAKRQAFRNWLAFCHAKNAIVTRLADEFRAVRCMRRWKLELSRRRALQALAHVQTYYLEELISPT